MKFRFDTFVGERGVILSSIQRQRIAIASAFYKGCNIWIFDKATSVLDSEIENVIMDSIYSFNKHLTIFIIAHRISTLSKCDIIEIIKQH